MISSANAPAARSAVRLTSLARPSTATVRLDVSENHALRAGLRWSEPTLTAMLARKVVLELAEIDVARLQCERIVQSVLNSADRSADSSHEDPKDVY